MPPQGKFYLLFEGSNHGYLRYALAHCHMIDTLSNTYAETSLVVKVPHYTHAIRTLMTPDILPYGLDNVMLLQPEESANELTADNSFNYMYM